MKLNIVLGNAIHKNPKEYLNVCNAAMIFHLKDHRVDSVLQNVQLCFEKRTKKIQEFGWRTAIRFSINKMAKE